MMFYCVCAVDINYVEVDHNDISPTAVWTFWAYNICDELPALRFTTESASTPRKCEKPSQLNELIAGLDRQT